MLKTILIVLIVAVIVIALMMAVLGFKMMIHKEEEYHRPCTNADPRTGRCAHCTCEKSKIKK